jgi:glyoxylase-like metal-dependent hydrolase (beta-lactamase superfamily II)
VSVRRVTRRVFLADFGKGTVAALVLTACSPGGATPTTVSDAVGSGATPSTTPPSTAPASSGSPGATTTTAQTPATAWARVDLSSVSAYLLVRAGEAAIVDTGVAGSQDAIGEGLGHLGVGWEDVAHVVLTHKHLDHAGSIGAVMTLAASARAYAGAGDIPAIDAPRPLVGVGDGDRVFGCSIIETPGHTPGHISVLDPGRILFAGDALNGTGGGVTGPNPRYSEDMATANRSVIKLAGFDFDAVVFGHGEPVTSGGARLVAELAATL